VPVVPFGERRQDVVPMNRNRALRLLALLASLLNDQHALLEDSFRKTMTGSRACFVCAAL
jgi:hypothetical protein